MCICFVVGAVIFLKSLFLLSAAEIINSKLKYMYVSLICLACWGLGVGGKTGQEFPYTLE